MYGITSFNDAYNIISTIILHMCIYSYDGVIFLIFIVLFEYTKTKFENIIDILVLSIQRLVNSEKMCKTYLDIILDINFKYKLKPIRNFII